MTLMNLDEKYRYSLNDLNGTIRHLICHFPTAWTIHLNEVNALNFLLLSIVIVSLVVLMQ